MHHAQVNFLRRLMAICYDSIIVSAMLMLATFIFLLLFDSTTNSSPLWSIVFKIYLLSITYLYFTFFWTKTGQTIGMMAWKLKLIANDTIDYKLNLKEASIYFFCALLFNLAFGFGLFWLLIDDKNKSFYEKITQLRLVQIFQD